MKKFKIACIALSVLALPFMMSCSKSSSSSEEEQIESFNTINARLYYTNSSLVPESVEMGIGETIQIYAGNGSTKAPFNGTVKWTAVGSGELALSAVQRNAAAAGVAPGTKAGYDYSTSTATTNANYNLKITAKSDGIVALTAKDPIGSTRNIVITIFPDDESED